MSEWLVGWLIDTGERKVRSELCETVEPIEMSFVGKTREGPRNHALHGVHIGATGRIQLNDPCVAAPFSQGKNSSK